MKGGKEMENNKQETSKKESLIYRKIEKKRDPIFRGKSRSWRKPVSGKITTRRMGFSKNPLIGWKIM